MVKRVDSASPQIQSDVISGTLFPQASLLFYNSTPFGQPDASVNINNAIANNYQLLGGTPSQERVGFDATIPVSMYLDVPGITGESSAPGYSNLMQIDSFSLSDNSFSIVKQVDTASPEISMAVTNATFFSSALLLLYDSAPSGPPDAVLSLHEVLASSVQPDGGGDRLLELDSFSFTYLTPEPSSLVLIGLSLATFMAATGFEIQVRRASPNSSQESALLPEVTAQSE